MKPTYLAMAISIFFIASCGNGPADTLQTKNENTPAKAESREAATETNEPATDSLKWIDSFRAFRDAVYQHDKEKIKQFIDFPIANEHNHLWYLITDGKDNSSADSPRPFTEADFDKYSKQLFTKRFITCMLKLKTEDLYKTGRVETKKIKEGNTTYILYADVDKEENKLILHLNGNTPYQIAEGEWEAGEFSEIYVFDILSNGKIKFRQIQLAG